MLKKEIVFSLFFGLSFCLHSQVALDSSRWQLSAGTNLLQYFGNNDLSYFSQPGFYFDFLYQNYIGSKDSVNEHSIMEMGLRFNYFRGEYGVADESVRSPYVRRHFDIAMGAGVRLFTRECSEGYIIAGVTAGLKNGESELQFAPTAYLKGGFNYFSSDKNRSHGPYLIFILQDAFFLNDFASGDYWALFSINACYSYRF